jgi:two-component sensor histidine kinase
VRSATTPARSGDSEWDERGEIHVFAKRGGMTRKLSIVVEDEGGGPSATPAALTRTP